MGNSIASVTGELPDEEVEELRALYIRRQKHLGNTWRRGEGLAARELSGKGYTILERNYRAAGGEIDLIATKDRMLAFVEVKTVNARVLVSPETRVTPNKQRQIARVAGAYLRNNRESGLVPRFDVIGIDLSLSPPNVKHIEAAFQVNDG
jgi:putative endonuclease